jgi:23S rRNA pseudouridine1911/1915/1917 synthase
MLTYDKIFENDEYLVVNKPAGLLTHGASHIKEKSLADFLLEEYPGLARVGEGPDRPGMMHRLDKLVSGILVIAKTPDSYSNLKEQFQARIIDKNYTALVYGSVDKDEGEIKFPIERSTRGFKMAALPLTVGGEKNESGRRAVTEFRVMKRLINYTLLEVRIKTGRTHQIRVHLSAYGCPIAGDDLYGTKKTRIKNKKFGLERIFLHAHRLAFDDLSGERKEYTADLPDDFMEFLNKAK